MTTCRCQCRLKLASQSGWRRAGGTVPRSDRCSGITPPPVTEKTTLSHPACRKADAQRQIGADCADPPRMAQTPTPSRKAGFGEAVLAQRGVGSTHLTGGRRPAQDIAGFRRSPGHSAYRLIRQADGRAEDVHRALVVVPLHATAQRGGELRTAGRGRSGRRDRHGHPRHRQRRGHHRCASCPDRQQPSAPPSIQSPLQRPLTLRSK